MCNRKAPARTLTLLLRRCDEACPDRRVGSRRGARNRAAGAKIPSLALMVVVCCRINRCRMRQRHSRFQLTSVYGPSTIRRTPQMRGRPQRDSAIFIEGLVTNRFVLSQRAVRPKARRLPPQDAKNFGVEGA